MGHMGGIFAWVLDRTYSWSCSLTEILMRTFHAKMGTIKDRNGMGLTGAEDVKKMWKEYTEELYKKDLQIINKDYLQIIMMG